MTDEVSTSIERLQRLAEFRFQLRKFLSFSETAADAAGISAQQYQLLQVIAATTTGRGAAINYLADRMFLRHNSAVELVDRAVRAGLVRRDSDEEDLRRSLVTLTPEGRELIERLVAAHLVEMEARGPEIVAAIERVLEPAEVDAAK